jgi:hypothetical protein
MKESLTLTRWHKVIERLNSAANELIAKAEQQLLGMTIDISAKAAIPGSVVELRSQRGMQMLEEADLLLKDVSAIRVALSEANTKVGITGKLAMMDVAARQAKMWKTFSQNDDTKMSYEMFALIDPASQRTGYGQGVYRIAVLSEAEVDAAQVKYEMYKRQATVLSDEIADANREKLTIDISEISKKVSGV